VAALVTGLLGMVLLAVILGIVALVQIARRGERGRGLAVGGLAAAALWTVVVIVGVAMLPEGDADGSSQDPAFRLFPKAGECFDWLGAERDVNTRAVPCDEPHDGEVVVVFSLDKEPWPGEEEVERTALKGCGRKNKPLLKDPPVPLEQWYIAPGQESWASGDRTVICYLAAEKGELKRSVLPR
jgi:hypothetical protein